MTLRNEYKLLFSAESHEDGWLTVATLKSLSFSAVRHLFILINRALKRYCFDRVKRETYLWQNGSVKNNSTLNIIGSINSYLRLIIRHIMCSFYNEKCNILI